MNLLVIGGSGFLGRELTRLAPHAVTATFHRASPGTPGVTWLPLDVRHRDDVERVVVGSAADTVINAAYRQDDWATTADGAAHVALAAAAAGVRLVHVSSDAVFGGRAEPYDETSVPAPVHAYGAAKAAAETAVKAIAPSAVVARTSLILGHGESPPERFTHALAAGTATGGLFTDDIRCAVHVSDLAAALLELAASPHAGVHHVAGADAVSRHELGTLIAVRDGLDPARLPTALRAVSGPPGPLDVRLECTVTRARIRTRLRGAREFLARAAPANR